jgi:hypothetical protein
MDILWGGFAVSKANTANKVALADPPEADFLNARRQTLSHGVRLPPMSVRPPHFFAVFAVFLAALARADDAPAGAETMAEHRLKDIVQHQKVLLSDAAAQGPSLDQAGFTTQVEQLTREYESLLRDNPNFAAGYASYGYMLWKIGLRKQAVGHPAQGEPNGSRHRLG